MTSTQQTMSQLRQLRLTSMANAYQLQLEQPKLHQLPFNDRFGMLVEHEVSERERRKLKRIVSAAELPEPAALEDLTTGQAAAWTKRRLRSSRPANGCDATRT